MPITYTLSSWNLSISGPEAEGGCCGISPVNVWWFSA
jgi:hypothetical protein